jgi:hypothetical protein
MLTFTRHSKSLRTGSQPVVGLLCGGASAQGWSEGGRQGYAPAIVLVRAQSVGTPATFPMNPEGDR